MHIPHAAFGCFLIVITLPPSSSEHIFYPKLFFKFSMHCVGKNHKYNTACF